MIISAILAKLDRVLSDMFCLMYHFTPSVNEQAGRANYFSTIGPRFVIFREGKIVVVGGMFEIVHQYSFGGALLSRRLLFKAERKPGDVVLFGSEINPEVMGQPSQELTGGLEMYC